MRAWGAVFAGFPNPIGWAIDKLTDFVGGVATAGFEALIVGLVAWVTDAVVWVIGGVFNFFIDAADPNVEADWFVASDGPYGTTVGIGAVLLVGFLLAGITQGVLSGDVGGMLRRIALDLPVSVLGMVGLVTVTQALIRLTDELSMWVMRNFQDDVSDFIAVVASLSSLAGGGAAATAFVVLVLGLVSVLVGLALVAELAVRAALIYIVVALAPFVLAARLWPSFGGVAKRLLQLLVALILSKLAMAVALAVTASAAVGAGSGGEVTSLPEPELFAEDPGGSVTQAVGILLAAVAAFGVAAFSPLMVSKLLPLTEAAIVAQGIRGMPVRGATQAASMAYYSQVVGSFRLRRLAHGSLGPSSGPPYPPDGSRPPELPPGSGRGRPPGPRDPSPAAQGGSGADGGAATGDTAKTGHGSKAGGRGAVPSGSGASSAGAGGAAGATGTGSAVGGPAGVVAAAGAQVAQRVGTAAKRGGSAAVDQGSAPEGAGGGSPSAPAAVRRSTVAKRGVPGEPGRRAPNGGQKDGGGGGR